VQDHRIGRRYALALFETALNHGIVDAVEGDLDAIQTQLETDPSFKDFLIAPYRSRDQKFAILEKVFSDKITSLTLQMLRIMLVKKRETEITALRHEYIELRRKHSGIVHVVVTTTETLDETQTADLTTKLSTTLGKQIEAEFQLDPSLIGGIKVGYENKVTDGTAKGSLARLRETLKYDLLKRLA
jgi:F-type H+-transporting ATPase subunit delta